MAYSVKKEMEYDDGQITLAQLSDSMGLSLPPTTSKVKRKSLPNPPRIKFLKIKHLCSSSSSYSISKHVVSHDMQKPDRWETVKAVTSGSSTPEIKSGAMVRAEEVQSNLGQEFPSFIKLMVRSHVTSCFWMGLPASFSVHLPKNDATMILEDENGEQFEAKLIADRTGLSAGWRAFANVHKIMVGDVLVFQLVGPTKFKVYILRINDLTEVDGALALLNMDACIKQNDANLKRENLEMSKRAHKGTKRKQYPISLPLAMLQPENTNPALLEENSENDSAEVNSEVLEGSRLSRQAVHFKDINDFENFTLHLNELLIDSELPKHIQDKYYRLCCIANEFLHHRILKGMNCKLIAGIISETVNIADALRACKLTTSPNDFAIWDKTLKSFEQLGMNVGFLRVRLRRLVSLAFECKGAVDSKKYIEARNERARAEEEIRNLEVKLVELKQISKRVCSDMKSLKLKAESYELKFHCEANAPW